MVRADLLEERFVEHAVVQAPSREPFHRVDLPPVVDQAFRVILGAGGLFVPAHAERFEFEEDGAGVLPNAFGGVFHCVVDRKNVVAIHLNGVFGRNAVPDCFVGEMLESELLVRRRTQAPSVVFDADDDRQLPDGCYVDGFMKIAFRGAAVSGEHERGFLRLVQFVCQCDAVGDAQLRSEVRNHPHNVVFG